MFKFPTILMSALKRVKECVYVVDMRNKLCCNLCFALNLKIFIFHSMYLDFNSTYFMLI